MRDALRHFLTRLGVWTAHPASFLILILFTAAWLIIEPETFDWHSAATIATWLMTLLIVRAEHRDTQAIHAKLDELLKADEGARSGLGTIDEEEPEDIEKQRKQEHREA